MHTRYILDSLSGELFFFLTFCPATLILLLLHADRELYSGCQVFYRMVFLTLLNVSFFTFGRRFSAFSGVEADDSLRKMSQKL